MSETVRRTCFAVACGAAQHPHATKGAIAGLARDHDSGDAIAKAEIRLRAQGDMTAKLTRSGADGSFTIADLAPGQYSLTASFAGQPVGIENIEVHAGEPTIVDITFTLGRPDPVRIDFGDPKPAEIGRYKPPHHADSSLIEGTVNDSRTHERVAGAVVTAVNAGATLQVVSDDQGRYRFDPVTPGTYSVSAYYSISGHGQWEVRRSDIHVAAAEGVVVPLWVEIAKQ